jgi:hypothetical protein
LGPAKAVFIFIFNLKREIIRTNYHKLESGPNFS